VDGSITFFSDFVNFLSEMFQFKMYFESVALSDFSGQRLAERNAVPTKTR
jgi:hypothetical protein